jgi:hypothetical protein
VHGLNEQRPIQKLIRALAAGLGSFTVAATLTAPTIFYPTILAQGILTTPGNQPSVVASGTAPTFTLSLPLTNGGPTLMQSIGTFCTLPPIWSVSNPNVDMTGVTTTAMNSFGTSAVTGNGCGP